MVYNARAHARMKQDRNEALVDVFSKAVGAGARQTRFHGTACSEYGHKISKLYRRHIWLTSLMLGYSDPTGASS